MGGRVSLENVKYVLHLKKAIKEELKNALDGYDAANLTLKATEKDVREEKNAIELDEEKELASVLEDFGLIVQDSFGQDDVRKLFADSIRLYVYPPTSKYPYFSKRLK